MSMSTTRSLRNRSSRYSSPATFTETQAPPEQVDSRKSNDEGQSRADKWVEPTVRNPVPSFEDTKGLERVGVLEHMAPLGIPPSQKLLQKLKVNLNRSSPRVTPVNVDEVTPPIELARTDVISPVEEDAEARRREQDDIWLERFFGSPPRVRSTKTESEEVKQVTNISTPSPVKTTFASAHASPRPQSIQDYIRQDRMKGVIDRAIKESKQSDPKLIPGIELLWEDAKNNPKLFTVLDAILSREPTDAQLKVLKRYIKRGVRHYRRRSTGQNVIQSVNNSIVSPYSQPPGYIHTFSSRTNSAPQFFADSHSTPSPFKFRSSVDHPTSPVHSPTLSLSTRMAPFPTENEVRSSSKRKRSHSESSTSSLSSAKSMPEDFSSVTAEADAADQAAEGHPVRSTSQRQATNRVAAGSRTRSSVVPQSEPSQPPPGALTTVKPVSKKQKSAHNRDDQSVDHGKLEATRRLLHEDSFHDYNSIPRPVSFERAPVQGLDVPENYCFARIPPPVIHPNSLPPITNALLSPADPQARPELPALNGAGRKRPYDEVDKESANSLTPLSSSPAPSFVPPPPNHADVMRGSTPRPGRLPPPNKARKSARVMVSPNKPKNGGITAGISRAGTERGNVIGNGTDSGAEDNDEFCASCGGEGILLCCDGCTNSFHHGCLEPPLDPDVDVEGEWYCPRCIARRNKESSPATGLMGQIIRRVDHIIPKAYALPYDIRDYFEGVKTGDEGEYEEVGLPRTQNTGAKMNRAGFFEEPSYKELRDSKGNFITCYRCQMTSNGRDIIPCDYCPAKWHMDCVDPPLAVPPRRRGGDKPTGYWRCPLHVDGDLAELGRQVEASPGDLGRLPRLRKPKKAVPIDVDLTRGFKNNGVIEVELMKDETPGIREVSLDGGIYRLPEKGIRLDFIDRVKKSWYEDRVFPKQLNGKSRIRNRLYRPDDPVLHHPAGYVEVKHKRFDFFKSAVALTYAETARTNAHLRQKSFKEQSAVISLLTLSQEQQQGRSVDPLADLTNALIAEAPENVANVINTSEKEMLLKLQKLVGNRLALLEDQDKRKTAKLADNHVSETCLVNGDTTE